MLGKLIKYEIKSIYKYFLVLYAIIIVGAITSYGTVKASSDILSKLGFSSFILCILAIIALNILLLIFTITRFNSSLLGDEGYLMFTVPTSTHNIIWSKAIAMLIFNLISFIIVGLVIGGYIFFIGSVNAVQINEQTFEIASIIFSKPSTYMVIFLCILHLLVSIVSSTMVIYASLSFGQMPMFKKHKNISAIGFFVGFTIFSNYLISKFGLKKITSIFESYNAKYSHVFENIDMSKDLQKLGDMVVISGQYFSWALFVLLLAALLELIILYLITYYILNKRLNLD